MRILCRISAQILNDKHDVSELISISFIQEVKGPKKTLQCSVKFSTIGRKMSLILD